MNGLHKQSDTNAQCFMFKNTTEDLINSRNSTWQGRRSIFRMGGGGGGGARVRDIKKKSARSARIVAICNIYCDFARGARRKIENFSSIFNVKSNDFVVPYSAF